MRKNTNVSLWILFFSLFASTTRQSNRTAPNNSARKWKLRICSQIPFLKSPLSDFFLLLFILSAWLVSVAFCFLVIVTFFLWVISPFWCSQFWELLGNHLWGFFHSFFRRGRNAHVKLDKSQWSKRLLKREKWVVLKRAKQKSIRR
jgi:hypothetical protein